MNLLESLENVLLHWQEITGLQFCLLDETLTPIISIGDKKLPSQKKLTNFWGGETLQMGNSSYHLLKVSSKNARYLLIVFGKGASVPTIAELAACQVESLCNACQGQMNKNAFMQNLLLGNYSEVDLFNKARHLHIQTDVPRVVFLVETKKASDESALATVRNIFSARTADFITAVNSSRIIIIRELNHVEEKKEMDGIAAMLVDMLSTEAMVSAWVAYSTVAEDLTKLPHAYKEATAALEVGKIFYAQNNVFGYHSLGIGRLIYQLPPSVCEMFIKEIFQTETLQSLDEETLAIIRTLFDNNLNLSETARKLYVHRNTLVYRLEKLEKKFGLDIRTFEDAMTFKIAMMVANYLKFRQQ